MRAVTVIITAAVLFVSAPCIAENIAFQQAVEQALGANPQTQASEARAQAADGWARAVRGQGLPSLSVEVKAAYSDDPVQAFSYRLAQRKLTFSDFGLGSYTGPGDLNVAPPELNRSGYTSNFNSAAILRVPLFTGGGDQARTRAAEARYQAAVFGNAATKAQVTFEVLRAYDGVAAARLLLDAARSAQRAAVENVKTAGALYKRGVSIKSDVLTARANLARAGAVVAAAEAAQDDALDSFRMVIAAPLDSRLEPDTAVDVVLNESPLSVLQQQAITANPRVQALSRTVAARAEELHAAHAANWPRVDLIARHDWNADTPALRAPSDTVMAVMSWNLFTSGAQKGGVDAARAEWRAAQADLAGAKDMIRLEVAKRRRAAQVADTQAKAADAAATEASEAAHLLDLRYAQGLAPLDDLLNAQARRDHGRAEAVAAAYRAVLARAALLLALDQLDPKQVITRPLKSPQPEGS